MNAVKRITLITLIICTIGLSGCGGPIPLFMNMGAGFIWPVGMMMSGGMWHG